MSFRLAAYKPVRGSCPNRNRRLRLDHGGDILAGVPVHGAIQIKILVLPAREIIVYTRLNGQAAFLFEDV